jgi:SAM-dependent methyltransferase
VSQDTPEWHLKLVADYWDTVAHSYLDLFRDEFDDKPYDRDILRTFIASLPAGGRVLDAGCGPCGHVARLLANEGLEVTGIDISPTCVALARAQAPLLRFEVMNIAGMTFTDASFDGIVAYYALHYMPASRLPGAIRELARTLRKGGRLLIVAKDGTGEGWTDDPMGIAGRVFWSAIPPDTLRSLVAANGFSDVECDTRAALAQEIDVRRIYLTAVRT